MRVLKVLLLLSVAAIPLSAQKLEFANARYASQSSHTLYAGYGAGPGLVFVGVLQNPRSAYREALVGVARPLGAEGRVLLLGAALATTSKGGYAQLYVLPTLSVGRLRVDVTSALQKPLGGGPSEVSVSPANLLLAVSDGWRVGATWTLSATVGKEHRQALGPALMRAVPGGMLGLHLLAGFGQKRNEVWLTAKVTP